MWNAIALTCQDVEAAKAYQNELNVLKQKGLFPESVPVLVVEDSVPGLGSGGSTLNALLIVAEHLCAKSGYTVLTNQILSDAKILIVHTGRNFIFDPCGRAFVDFPAVTVSKTGHEIRLNTFVHLYLSITELLHACESNSPPGVWVCGSDGVLVLDADHCTDWANHTASDIITFTIPVSPNFAAHHGVFKLNGNNIIEDVLYQKDLDILEKCTLPNLPESRVPLVLAMMFMSTKVADAILYLHNTYPLTCSTYIGEDSGIPGFKLSLFFDFLLPTCANVSENDFTSGSRAGSRGMPGNPSLRGDQCEERDAFVDIMPLARKLIWDAMRPFKTRAVFLNPLFYHYFTNDAENFMNFFHNIQTPLSKNPKYKVWKKPVVNSSPKIDSGYKNFLLYNCGSLTTDKNENYREINQDFELFCFFDTIPSSSTHSTGKYNVNVFVDKKKNLNEISHSSDSQCPNQNNDLCITACGDHTVETLHFTDPNKILPMVDLKRHFDFKRQKSCQVSLSFIDRTLINNIDFCLLPVFSSLAVDGYANEMLETLDKGNRINNESDFKLTMAEIKLVAETCNDTGICARVLSCIADVLGILAVGNGGLRSGPAMHRDWIKVFKVLENGLLNEGLTMMAGLRSTWMDTPLRLIRAARHYEAAAQIFTRKTVKQTKNFISIQKSLTYPDYGVVHGARAAARIDMAGGWSDTPPITYEHGGSVVNVAIQIDGQKPVGAKAVRVQKPVVKAYCISDNYKQTVTFRTIADIANFSNPNAPGALVAAVIVCSEVVDPTSMDSLEDQLMAKFQGGFKIYYWSNVPQGSGLGTSSILAGCLLAAVWQAIGVKFDVDSILHAVLYIEQLLTTGGGWQDQVGGLCRGVKIGRFSTAVDFGRINHYECLLSPQAYQWLNDRLLLVYTGKTRLAKNLLQEVVRNWFARKSDIVEMVDALVSNAERCKLALEEENWETVADCTKLYWDQKKFMAPGSEPVAVADLLTFLYSNQLIFSGWLAGAGGGGFLYLISREPNNFSNIKSVLSTSELWKSMTVHKVDVDLDPFQLFTE